MRNIAGLRALLLAGIFCIAAQAFIPPLPQVVREVFDGRKPRPKGTEVVLRHHIEVRQGDVLELEERIVVERGAKPRFLWKVVGQGTSVSGTWERQSYVINGEKVATRSGAFLKYLLTSNGDEFLSQLTSEGFVRRDQFLQFKPGFAFEGDPGTWDLAANYLRHTDIYLHRLRHGVGIAVVGTDDGTNHKAVYFDQALHGVRRLEWKEGPQTVAWDFDAFSGAGKEGWYPRQMFFQVSNETAVEDKIRTELIAIRSLGDRQEADFNAAYGRGGGSTPSNVDAALRLLLGYR